MTMASDREWLTVAKFKERNPALGKNLIYDAVREGRLPSIRIGGKILIPSDALDQLLERSGTARSQPR
jgi:excisionase family DNA binding protein